MSATLALAIVASKAEANGSRLVDDVASGWVVEGWSPLEGLPVSAVTSLARTPDGLVWIGSYDGLARFDGEHFEVLPGSGPGSTPGTRILSIASHPADGALWVATESGVLQRRTPGKNREFVFQPERPLHLALGRSTLWATVDGARLRLDAEPLAVTPGGVDRTVTLERPDGGVCATRADGSIACTGAAQEGPEERIDLGGAKVGGMVRDGEGEIVLLDSSGVPRWRLGAAGVETVEREIPLLPAATPPMPSRWTLQGREVRHDGRRVVTLGSDAVAVLVDGTAVWVATATPGLYRIHPAALTVIRPDPERPSLVERLWWDDVTRRIWARSSESGWWAVDEPGTRLPAPPSVTRPTMSTPLRVDGALHWRRHDRVVDERGTEVEGGPGSHSDAYAAENDRLERTWLGLYAELWLATNGRWAQVRSGGEPVGRVRDVVGLETGDTWVAAVDGPRRVPAGSTQADPPPKGWTAPARHLRVDGEWLWVATEGQGLCALGIAGARWRCLDENYLPGRTTVHASLADGLGRAWIATNRGIGVAWEVDLRAFARGETSEVPTLWLDERDGLLTREANGFLGGGALNGADARLWFATQDGVASVDPVTFRPPAAPVARFDGPAALELPPDAAPLRLSWFAVALDHPEQLVFRTRLDGGPWSPPTTSRDTQLDALEPGPHRFEVQARLGSDWGPAAALAITRIPPWHARPGPRIGLAFLGLVCALLAGGLAGTLRTRALRRRAEALEKTVQERTAELASANEGLRVRNDEQARAAEALRAANREVSDQAEKLDRLVRLQRDAVATASHELRTPLTLVLGPLAEVERTLPEGGAAAARLATARANALRLDAIVQQLFQLSRAQAGALRLAAERADLRAIVGSAVDRFRDDADQRGIVLASEFPSAAVRLWFDAEIVETALGNLLANALRYVPRGGRISVVVTSTDAWAEVRVTDTGPGVPVALRDRVFDRFVRGEGQAPGDGAGLGLALVKELVERHGGEVGLDPGCPGAGARFWFRLPTGSAHLAPGDIAPGRPRPEDEDITDPPTPAAGPRKRVLLVEDDGALRGYLREHLAEGYAVEEAEGGEDALRMARVSAPDIVVSDLSMPRGDGLTLARELRADTTLRGVPILLVSARAGAVDRVEGLGHADDFLAKPVYVPELLARVSLLLRRAPATGSAAPVQPAGSVLLARLGAAADPRLGDPAFGAEELARAVAMSRRTLHRQMIDAGLDAPTRWLLERRLATGRHLLRSRRCTTVGEAAAAVGLSRPYFTQAYAAWCGRSPGDDLRDG